MMRPLICSIVASSLLFTNPAWTKDSTQSNEIEIPMVASAENALAALALTCSDKSWQEFTKLANARKGPLEGALEPGRSYKFKVSDSRVSVEEAGVVVERLSSGGLEARWNGKTAKGADGCELVSNFVAEQKKSASHRFWLPEAKAVEETAKDATAEVSFLDGGLGVLTLAAAFSSGPLLTFVLGAFAGSWFAKSYFNYQKVQSMKLHEQLINTKSLALKECTADVTILTCVVNDSPYRIVINKHPSDISIYQGLKKLQIPHAAAAVNSREMLRDLARRCNNEDDRTRLNDRLHSLVESASVRIADFRGKSKTTSSGSTKSLH